MRKTVLITGCSSGFGRLTARIFHENGWNVIATMRSPEREAELTELENTLVNRLDVTDPGSIRQSMEEGRTRFGPIDVVVNNAGYGGNGLFEQFTDADARAMFDANVFGPMNVMREALPHMREAGAGTIVNVSSMAGRVPVPGSAIYSASKFALVGLTEAMALEYAPLGIRIFDVAPGAYPTTRFGAALNERLDRGDEQLVDYAKRQRAQLSGATERMATEGGAMADPREVAERIFACATSDMPIANPVGSDSEMLTALMRQNERQDFLDQIAEWAVPQEGVQR